MGDDIVSILCYMSGPSICLCRLLRLCACYRSHMQYMACMCGVCANVHAVYAPSTACELHAGPIIYAVCAVCALVHYMNLAVRAIYVVCAICVVCDICSI